MLLIKFLIFCFCFTGCVREETVHQNQPKYSALSGSHLEAKWSNSISFPLTLKYGTNFSTNELMAIENSANNWNDSVQNEIHFFDIQPSQVSEKVHVDDYNDTELGVYKLTKWPTELPPTALAITQIFGEKIQTSTDTRLEIQHADILVNFENFEFSSNGGFIGYDLETIIIHEMGHFLGLAHQDSSPETSIMYPTIGQFTDSKIPKEIDISNILAKYSVTNTRNESNERETDR